MNIAAIPTMPGREPCLEKAVDSLIGQVDLVVVFMNGPMYPVKRKDSVAYLNGKDFGSARRFEVFDIFEKGFHLTMGTDSSVALCDDDLLYPPDYIKVMKEALDTFGGIVTCHGRVLDKGRMPLKSWHKEAFKSVHPCLEANPENITVDIAGTGAMMINPFVFSPRMNDFKHPNYDDVEFSILAHKAKKKMVCIKHAADWIKYLNPPAESTIWHQTSKQGHRPLLNLVNSYDWGL